MNSEKIQDQSGRFARLLREQALLIAIVTLVFGGAAFAYSKSQTPSYVATASLNVQDPASGTGVGTTVNTPAQLAASEGPRVNRLAVAEPVKTMLATDLSVQSLRNSITTLVDPTSNVLSVQATASSAKLAADIANAFAQQDASQTTAEQRALFAAQAQEIARQVRALGSGQNASATRLTLDEQLARLRGLASVAAPVQIIGLATPPSSAASPKTLRNTIILAILGLLIGIAVADTRRARDRRLRTADDIARQIDLPLIGHVSKEALGHGGLSETGSGLLSDADVEACRMLRQNLQLLDPDSGIGTVVVTSATAQDGKSTVATLLARASAATGKMTLLIECDLRRPVLAQRLGLVEAPGLTDYLLGKATPQEVVQRIPGSPLANISSAATERTDVFGDKLFCITAGSEPRPAELLGTERFRTFLESVSQAYDFVVIDTGPILAVVDTLELIPLVQGVIMCVRAAKTTRDEALAAYQALGRTRSRPAGIVVTGVTPKIDPYYEYYAPPALG